MKSTHETPLVRVAVADDSTIFRTSLIKFLAILPNIEVVAEATNGQEALQLVAQTAPDILILDMQMPVMDGMEVLRQLQTQETDVQVLVLSAHGEGYAEQAMATGAAVFVSKGDIPRLIATLASLSNERRQG